MKQRTLSEHEKIEKEVQKRQMTRQKRRKSKMRVSGKSVFELQKIIRNKK